MRRILDSSSRAIFVLLVGLATACASGGLETKSIPVTANPSEQLGALAAKIEQARQAKAPVLAPTWFGRADASYEQAKTTLEQGGSVQEIMALVAKGNAEVEQAQKFVTVSQSILPAVIKARADARAAGATSLGEPYTEAEERFVELTAAVEQDNVSWAEKKAPGVERAFRSVELQAIKASAITEIRKAIELARSEGAEKLVPQTLAATEKMEASLDSFITSNRYASAEMGERTTETLFQANRLVALTRVAASIQKTSPEDQALQREKSISTVAAELALPDLRDRDSQAQLTAVANAVRELRKDRDYLVAQSEELRAQIATSQAQIAKLEGQSTEERLQIGKLEEQRRLQEQYTEVSSYFTPSEAEVYKKGTQLVVRLRGVQFPVGESVLQPDDYELLSKVQKAIRSFDKPTVVIEGHTDSTGSAQVNDHLSQMRAEAVAAYLVANNTLPEDHVVVVGKGFSEPLASNKTADGRALNRRIDILIDPGHTSPTPAVAAPAEAP